MASSITGYTNPQALPKRLPKLSYRTKSCDTDSLSSASTGLSQSTASTTPTSPLSSDFYPSSPSRPSEMAFPASPRQSSFAPSSVSSKTSVNPSKKRSNFFSGLFNAKEPSAQALHDYQRQLVKQGGGRATAAGLPGVSSAKLPATVPKVNSKWDGVPQTLKEKEKQQDAARQLTSGLSRQLGSSRSAGSEHRSASTAHPSRKRLSRGGVSMQSGSSNNLAEIYGWETNSNHSGSSAIDFAMEHRPATSRTTSSWSAPPLQKNSSFPPHDPIPLPHTELSPPSRFGSPNPPTLSYSPLLTPYDSSPVTPDAPSPFISLTSPKAEAIPQENIQTTLLDAPGSAEEVIVKSAGVNILGPPAVAKRKPRSSPHQPSDQRPNTSGAEFQFSSILRREAPIQKDTPSPRPALASYFPATMNTLNSDSPANVPARHNSTRERLGLGMNLNSQSAAPWQSPAQATDDLKVEGERIITPTPEGGLSLRRKSRMTLFKK